jgi:hypothetical protein
MSKAQELLRLVHESGAVGLDDVSRTVLQQVLKVNGKEQARYLVDELLLKEFAVLVADKFGSGAQASQIQSLITQAGVDHEIAKVFVANLGY